MGLFRKSGVKSRIQALRQMNESSPDDVNYEDQSAYDVADMVKQFFRDLPEPLLTSKLGETFLHIYQCKKQSLFNTKPFPLFTSCWKRKRNTNNLSFPFRCAQRAALTGCAGGHYADVRWKQGGIANIALLPEWCHFLRSRESDDAYEPSSVSGTFTFSSQHPEERQSCAKVENTSSDCLMN